MEIDSPMEIESPGLVVLRGVCPVDEDRRAWVEKAVDAFYDARAREGIVEARGIVGFLADDFQGLDPADRRAIVDLVAEGDQRRTLLSWLVRGP